MGKCVEENAEETLSESFEKMIEMLKEKVSTLMNPDPSELVRKFSHHCLNLLSDESADPATHNFCARYLNIAIQYFEDKRNVSYDA
ncbi:MAG TPA: hypothetical protein VKZ95_08745 [Sphingobacteriaceae bacterium]|nr:hypothetical protein [Sphingobacteriaceae bacterium]